MYVPGTISALNGDVLINEVCDSPKNAGERLQVNLCSESDSRTPRDTEGEYAPERYQVKPKNNQVVELRFFSDSAQEFLRDIDAIKKMTSEQIEFLFEDVPMQERQLTVSRLKSIQVDQHNGLLTFRGEGMSKESLISWLNALFTLHPNIMKRGNVIYSLYRHMFPHQTLLQFVCDPFSFNIDSITTEIIPAIHTSISREMVMASLDFLEIKYLALKTSEIEMMSKIFELEAAKIVIVFEQDTEYFIHRPT